MVSAYRTPFVKELLHPFKVIVLEYLSITMMEFPPAGRIFHIVVSFDNYHISII